MKEVKIVCVSNYMKHAGQIKAAVTSDEDDLSSSRRLSNSTTFWSAPFNKQV